MLTNTNILYIISIFQFQFSVHQTGYRRTSAPEGTIWISICPWGNLCCLQYFYTNFFPRNVWPIHGCFYSVCRSPRCCCARTSLGTRTPSTNMWTSSRTDSYSQAGLSSSSSSSYVAVHTTIHVTENTYFYQPPKLIISYYFVVLCYVAPFTQCVYYVSCFPDNTINFIGNYLLVQQYFSIDKHNNYYYCIHTSAVPTAPRAMDFSRECLHVRTKMLLNRGCMKFH